MYLKARSQPFCPTHYPPRLFSPLGHCASTTNKQHSSIATCNECLLVLLANLEELQNEERQEKEDYKDQIDYLKAKCQEKQEIVNISRCV